jgi:elongation factor P hydroxylase
MHLYEDLITIFNDCFFSEYSTRLVKGGDEPIYLPLDEQRPYHALCFAHGYFSSALHECAHWLIAGEERRKLVDFGYWYVPDGRTSEEQLLFQQVEVKPQAIEWILSKAANYRFRLSIDNLNGAQVDDSASSAFREAVYAQVVAYCTKGLSKRVERFRNALCDFYGSSKNLNIEDFDITSC